MKLQGSLIEGDAPFLMYMEKRSDFIKSNMYRTEKNVGKAFQGAGMEAKVIQNGSELWWTLKRKDQNESGTEVRTGGMGQEERTISKEESGHVRAGYLVTYPREICTGKIKEKQRFRWKYRELHDEACGCSS